VSPGERGPVAMPAAPTPVVSHLPLLRWLFTALRTPRQKVPDPGAHARRYQPLPAVATPRGCPTRRPEDRQAMVRSDLQSARQVEGLGAQQPFHLLR
jgi:hypothetical protein